MHRERIVTLYLLWSFVQNLRYEYKRISDRCGMETILVCSSTLQVSTNSLCVDIVLWYDLVSVQLMTTHPRIKDHSDSSSKVRHLFTKGYYYFSTSLLKVVPDVSAIIADFKLMGTGLVKSIEILSSPPTTSS